MNEKWNLDLIIFPSAQVTNPPFGSFRMCGIPVGESRKDDIMSGAQDVGPQNSAEPAAELKSLIERVVEATVARIEATAQRKPFVTVRS